MKFKYLGWEIELFPMDTVPMDGTPVLVYLETESLGSRWHSARFRPNYKLIGHHFAFDVSKPLGWIPQPQEIQNDQQENRAGD